ncbi:TrmD [Desulforapulum autotrophicum HRM2]|uniref:tRNA (guanine-N(1)-)-methyltransferase n=1 Tax=Desulforapulum autotrophicum (strain ATCC 43914 / DSM 3382 / VKM B-1955 / HRM2) TaxID=177437 RepID=C0QKU1_DESAH|nr:TrmD [Desulforapulum autotrophicum HRM2]
MGTINFTVLTLFPELVDPFFEHGIISRAVDKNIITGKSVNIRDFSSDRHNTVDDRPYGGGCGMLMKPEPLALAINAAKQGSADSRVILMTPQGRRFDQGLALDLAARSEDLIFVCGRYEGIDERVCHTLVDDEISIGDYVMTGGELAAMVIIDAITRLLPGVLGGETSADVDSFRDDRLEHAQFTRPPAFESMDVPSVLLSGDHGAIERWRKRSSLKRTLLNRPDLLAKRALDGEERKILKTWCQELEALINE